MSARNAVAAFALALALVVAGAAAGGALLGASPGDASSPPNASAYESGQLLPEETPESGAVEAPPGEKTVVIDTSHGNAMPVSEIQPLVNALVRAGHTVKTTGSTGSLGLSSSRGSLNATLRGADAYVVANPTRSFSDSQVAGVEAFADAGGRVLLLGDPPSQATTSSSLLGLTSSSAGVGSGQPTALARAFGVTFDAGYLYDMAENANHFQGVYAAGESGSTLAAGVERAVLRDAAALVAADATPVLTVESATLSSTRASGDYAAALRAGNATVVGDTDFLAPERATGADNDRLASNVAAFLVNGEKEPGAPAATGSSYPSFPSDPGNATA